MTVQVVDAHAYVQILVSVVKMVTVFQGVLPKSRVLLCVFLLWADRLDAKDIYKDMFPIYGGKCL
jgi:hypothetical protein